MVQIAFHKKAVTHTDSDGNTLALQDPGSLDALYDTVEEAEKKYIAIAKNLEELTGGKFHLGPIKERSVAEAKIERDYEGKPTLITDIVRGKLIIDSADAIEALRKIIATTNTNEALKEHKAYCAQVTDYFAEPKSETGYRALNAKIAIPVGNEDEYHLVELQVVHEDIEAVYDCTHQHMREAQNIAAKYRHTEIPNNEAERMHAHYAACKYANGCAAHNAGLDSLLINPNHALTEREACSLKSMISAHRLTHY